MKEEYDSIKSTMVQKVNIYHIYNDKGLILNYDIFIRNDSLDILELFSGLEYTYSEQNKLQSIIERREKDGKEIVNTINNYIYNSDFDFTIDRINVKQIGNQFINEVSEIMVFEYNEDINKYTTVNGKSAHYIDTEIYSRIKYDDNLNVSSVTFPGYEKIECFYDYLGRDSIWNKLKMVDGIWVNSSNVYFQYNTTESDIFIRTEKWYSINNSNEQLEVTNKSFFNGNSLDSLNMNNGNYKISFQYDNFGYIASYIESTNSTKEKVEYALNQDTLIINNYKWDSTTNEWRKELGYSMGKIVGGVYEFQIQKLPNLIFDSSTDVNSYPVIFHLNFDYGKLSEYSNFYDVYENGVILSDKMEFYYSQVSSPMIGNGMVEGMLFKNQNNESRTIDTTSVKIDDGVINATIHLVSKIDNSILATTTTNSEGFFQFKGVPDGNYQLNVNESGLQQINTYDIKVSISQKWFKNQNFIIGTKDLTNIQNNRPSLEIKIYPNPTSGILQIEGLSQNEQTVISIYNAVGQKIEQKKINKQNSAIDLSSYKIGTYYLSFNNSFKSAFKIIKE